MPKKDRSAADGEGGESTGRQRRLSRQSLADQVAETLREMILTGEIAPGSRITQSQIAEQLEVSTMPVREALLRLGAEGFLVAAPNRSFTVRPIREEDIRDIYWAHAVLAGELTARACENSDDAFVALLREREADLLKAARRRDRAEMDVANWRFHREINKAADAPKLWMLLHATLRYIPTAFYALVPAWAVESERGHAELLDAFQARDVEAAREAAATHVQAAGELLISSFWGSDRWITPSPGSTLQRSE